MIEHLRSWQLVSLEVVLYLKSHCSLHVQVLFVHKAHELHFLVNELFASVSVPERAVLLFICVFVWDKSTLIPLQYTIHTKKMIYRLLYIIHWGHTSHTVYHHSQNKRRCHFLKQQQSQRNNGLVNDWMNRFDLSQIPLYNVSYSHLPIKEWLLNDLFQTVAKYSQ